MGKYVIIGDLHCREVWKEIVKKENNVDKFIFLGDYLPPRHDVLLDDPTDACGFLYEVLDFKDKNPDKVILLRGNHDLDLIGYSWAKCYPKAHPKVEEYCRTNDVKSWFLKNTQWVYIIPESNIVCSHAGIGKYFFNKCKKSLNIESNHKLKVIYDINKLEPSELFAFNGGFWDTNGESHTQPCTWIRPTTLCNNSIEDIVQVVGHTPVVYIFNTKEEYSKDFPDEDCPEIWCCDCLENRQYLIIEDGEFKVCKI